MKEYAVGSSPTRGAEKPKLKQDTPTLEAVTVIDGKKAKAARIKHLKDAMIKLAPLFAVMREVRKLKSRIKELAGVAGITEYEIEEPNRVVLRFVEGSPNGTKIKLLYCLDSVLGDETEAQKFLDKLMMVQYAEGKDEGKQVLPFTDRKGYLNIGER
jgi:hypothetical protein